MDDELRTAILSYTSNPAYTAVKPKVIAERLGLEGDAADHCKKIVKKLVREGALEYGPNHLIVPIDAAHPSRANLLMPSVTGESGHPIASDEPASDSRRDRGNYVVGTLRRISSGDAFVRPEGTPASAERDLDIFVPGRQSGDAANGDMVRLAVSSRPGAYGKPTGKVVDIVERATNVFVGTYLETAGSALVEVDGKVFGQPIYVGDPGAKGAKEGDKVVIEMVRFPSQLRDGEGVITRILGDRSAPGVDTLSIKYEFNLPGEFPEDVLEDARQQAAKFDESIPAGRRDLTNEVIVTIDPLTARDFDDAISLKKLDNGHWELGVHIADVSHFVQPKSPLDREAYERATSVYLPDEVIPMLPEVISNNLASLQPDRVRYAVTAILEMSAEGMPVHCEVFKSAIKSRRRFTYEEVDQYLLAKGLVTADTPRAASSPTAADVVSTLTPEVNRLLADMFELAMKLRKRRFDRGALELSMPEVQIDLDKDGRVSGAHVEKNTESHQVIEEFMLAANVSVAHKLADSGLLFLRRIHGSPDPRKSRALTEFVRSLGMQVENLQDRFELQQLLDSVKGDPRQHAVNFSTLRSMQKAIYSPEDEGHYALAADCYCHFTSPIRRYPDLTIHRLIDALNNHNAGTGPKPVNEMGQLLLEGDHCSEREQRASGAERELKKMKLLNYLSDKVGTEMDGVITGVEKFGVFIMGRDLPAEGFIHITALGDDFYQFDRASHSISGRREGNTFRLGDAVRVAVANVDVDARELDFRYLGRAKGPDTAKTGPGSSTGGRKGRPLPADKKRRPSQGKNRQARERSAGAGGGNSGGSGNSSGSNSGGSGSPGGSGGKSPAPGSKPPRGKKPGKKRR